MIRVERPSRPHDLDPGGRARTARAELAAYWARQTETTVAATREPPPRPNLYASPAVRRALSGAFHGKCAYCESPIAAVAPIDVDHFRPKLGAVGHDGVVSRAHYWWLTYEWTNLLPICVDCNRAKGTRFPVRHQRAEPEGDLDAEGRLLLDPCVDDPEEHLVFFSDGTVASHTEEGRATIDTLSLNRKHLVEARAAHARTVLHVLDEVRSGYDAGFDPRSDEGQARLIGELEHFTRADQQYSAMSRQLIAAEDEAGLPRRLRRTVRSEFVADQVAKQSYELTGDKASMADADKSSYFGATRWVERLVVENFRPIAHLELDCASSRSTGAPWTVLLGENGTGKSTILQALALALIGDDYRRQLGLTPSRVLRYGTKRGGVTVRLSGNLQPFTLRYQAGEPALHGPAAASMLVLGYGSMRLLPRSDAPVASPTPGVARVDNLFNPFLPLPDPTAWLLSLPPAQLIDVTEKLKRLLALEEGTRIVADQERGEVTIRMRRTRSSLDELSDGYQSMLVLVCDVMRTVLTTWDTVEQAEGIVLIDELGAHLHPTWRMRIVGALREVLPRMQFIVSTHDPLCLRGLEDGEVIVLRRNERQRIVSLSDLPPVKGLRVDQLLTSEHFGLGSTDDPELDDLFQEYYRLRGVNRRSPKQDVELKRVEARLTALRQFGATDRERMVLQAADTYLARRREEPSDAPPMDEVVKSELATIWERVLPQRRRSQ